MKPLIGVTTSVKIRDYETPNQAVLMLPTTYPNAIKNAGGVPVLLTEGEEVESLLSRIDGLIIAGGRDIDPALYGEDPHKNTTDFRPEQDAWEIALMRAAIERDMPMLCVCRGHQLLSVERGGHLYQHLPETPGFEEHGSTGGEWSDHIVKIGSDSKLGAILGTQTRGNSGHHQGVADAGDLTVVGRTEDGLIEAVEMPDKKFVISTQWHPEMIEQAAIFDALIEAASDL